jgi:hypothetical protein
LKLKSYDDVIIKILWNLENKKILDYWAWPWILAHMLQRWWSDIKVYDLSSEMCDMSAERIWQNNVYRNPIEIPSSSYDVIICNLVLCIVDEEEVKRIMATMRDKLNSTGKLYVWFCNPLIYNIHESHLDIRYPTKHNYDENHTYTKVKKEWGYEIIEAHRPMSRYEMVFESVGLLVTDVHFTPEYVLNWYSIKDFVIYELSGV